MTFVLLESESIKPTEGVSVELHSWIATWWSLTWKITRTSGCPSRFARPFRTCQRRKFLGFFYSEIIDGFSLTRFTKPNKVFQFVRIPGNQRVRYPTCELFLNFEKAPTRKRDKFASVATKQTEPPSRRTFYRKWTDRFYWPYEKFKLIMCILFRLP